MEPAPAGGTVALSVALIITAMQSKASQRQEVDENRPTESKDWPTKKHGPNPSAQRSESRRAFRLSRWCGVPQQERAWQSATRVMAAQVDRRRDVGQSIAAVTKELPDVNACHDEEAESVPLV